MRRRTSIQAEEWPQVTLDEPARRINWPRVAFAGLLAATVAILVTLRFQATSKHSPQAVSDRAPAATEVSSAPKADFQATSEHNPQAVSDRAPAATEVSSAPKADSAPTLQLITEPDPAAQGEDDRLPLGIFVRGPSEIVSAAAIEIIGLPSGWALSAGRPFGHDWRIPAAQLSGAEILLPRGFSAAIDFAAELRLPDDTLVERQLVRRQRIDPGHPGEENLVLLRVAERLLAAGDMAAARLALRRSAEAGNVRAALLLGEIYDRVRIDPGLAGEKTRVLLGVAERSLAAGDTSAARLALRRAAAGGNARAALLLGETYDGCLIRRLNCSADTDPATARTWYEVAAEFGSTDARQRLDRLPRDQPRGDLPSRR
jgi:TPR repeat protein